METHDASIYNKKLSYRRVIRAMRLVSSNLANCHATVQKLVVNETCTAV